MRNETMALSEQELSVIRARLFPNPSVGDNVFLLEYDEETGEEHKIGRVKRILEVTETHVRVGTTKFNRTTGRSRNSNIRITPLNVQGEEQTVAYERELSWQKRRISLNKKPGNK